MKINNNKELVKHLTPALVNNKKIACFKESTNSHYNCYSFIARIFNWTSELYWLDEFAMNDYLTQNTRWIKKPKIGDIMVWRIDGYLQHTALVLDPNNMTIIQKTGGCQLESGRLDDKNDNMCYYNGNITYRRIK